MRKYYNGTYQRHNDGFYKISRSKIESFIQCKRCFFMDRKLKIAQPPGFPFNLNSAVDNLLKNEFDHYRALQQAHPYMIENKIAAIPYQHEKLNTWRENFKGVSFDHEELNFHLFGAVDDLWISTEDDSLIVVDYKATSKASDITLDAEWQMSYKRQMEFYQYLLRKNGFKVSNTGYFVYCNGIRQGMFNDCLGFKVQVIPYNGNDDWVENTIIEIHTLLNQDQVPSHSNSCAYCNYQKKVNI